MKILLVSIGTRGDIEPFLAQAEILSELGHQIICQFPEQFRENVEKLGYKFHGFDKRFLELLESKSGKAVMGGGGNLWNQLRNLFNLMKDSFKIQDNIIHDQKEVLEIQKPDRILFNTKCLYHFLAAMMSPNTFILLSPLPCLTHTTTAYTHISFAKWGPFSAKWNIKTYDWVNGARYFMMKRFLKKYYSEFPGFNFNPQTYKKFETDELQTIYTISPTLFPKPTNWPKSAKITGYFQRNQQINHCPDPTLENWLQKHPKAILLTFGSMSNPKPKVYSSLILNLLQKHKIPAIVNLSWGGLEKVSESNDSIFYVTQVPYDWILPKMHGVIHHGGSGTTHIAAVSGCVQMIVPHIADQYFWNRIIEERKLGPLGPTIHNFDPYKFEIALTDFWTNPEYTKNAGELAPRIKNEAKRDSVLNLIMNSKA